MSEGHNFEKHETRPLKVDFESILEKGEIESAKELEGYWGIQGVEIKDDGTALFRPDDVTDFMFEAKEMETRRSQLELMAYQIDQILGFDLIPTVVARTIGGRNGSLQRQIKDFSFTYGAELDYIMDNQMNPEEIRRAAIFDYILDTKDRWPGNFLIDSTTGKLWLIDHDFFMFFRDEVATVRDLIKQAKRKNLLSPSEADRASLERFLAEADSITVDAKPEIIEIIKKAQDRATVLLKEGQIPTTNI